MSLDRIIELRKELHALPEISGEEFATQNKILDFFSDMKEAQVFKVAKTGVLVRLDSKNVGPGIMIRGDIDALPIQETNDFRHKSTVDGVSHKCGHDGHTAILLGLALELLRHPIPKGQVFLLFQPSEENGKGARAVLADPVFQKHSIDFAFALHNLPGFDKHSILFKEGPFTASVKSMIIQMYGKTSHAAEPDKGHNPAGCIADILSYARQLTNDRVAAEDFFLITPIHTILGDKNYGISAGYGELHFTIRSWSPAVMKEKIGLLRNFIQSRCKLDSINPKISWTQEFEANINHPEATRIIRKAVKGNQLKEVKLETPFKWGEDFGLFTQRFKGAMFGLGAGKTTPALHNPDYDFPDEILSSGIQMFHSIIKEVLQ